MYDVMDDNEMIRGSEKIYCFAQFLWKNINAMDAHKLQLLILLSVLTLLYILVLDTNF